MERWRWLPHDLGSFYVERQHSRIRGARVVDGKPVHTEEWWSESPTSRRRSSPTRCRRSCQFPIGTCRNSIKTEEIRPFLREEAAGRRGRLEHRRAERTNLRVNIGAARSIRQDRLEQCRLSAA